MENKADTIEHLLNLTVPGYRMVDISRIRLIQNTRQTFSCDSVTFDEIAVAADDFVVLDGRMLVVRNNTLELYRIRQHSDRIRISLLKQIRMSCIFFYSFRRNRIRRVFLKVLLRLVDVPRYDTYLEGIIQHMSGEDITNIREYANGLEVEYGSAPVRWYDEYLNETDRSHLQKNPNNLVQSAFMIRVTRSGILLFRDETNFINRKRIHVKKYAVDGNVLYLMERDRMVCMVMK